MVTLFIQHFLYDRTLLPSQQWAAPQQVSLANQTQIRRQHSLGLGI